MMNDLIGTQAYGLRLPMLDSRVNLISTIFTRYMAFGPKNGDIIGVTESVVARCAGMYVNLTDVGEWIKDFKPTADKLILYHPIFSRNRFIPILRGLLTNDNIKHVTIVSGDVDEVGNCIEHQITGINYKNAYKEIIEESGRKFKWVKTLNESSLGEDTLAIDCRLHAEGDYSFELSLRKICSEKSSWGLLGMNAAGDNRIKLFPDEKYAKTFVTELSGKIKRDLNRDVEVMIYGDGAYKDPRSGIWEWADPVVSPAWTAGLNGMPTEIKLKNEIDMGLSEEEIKNDIESNRNNEGQALGTTPRRIVDLLGSLMDLMSGSGDKGTPVVIVRDYFKKYID